jgi:hypothetical protein
MYVGQLQFLGSTTCAAGLVMYFATALPLVVNMCLEVDALVFAGEGEGEGGFGFGGGTKCPRKRASGGSGEIGDRVGAVIM